MSNNPQARQDGPESNAAAVPAPAEGDPLTAEQQGPPSGAARGSYKVEVYAYGLDDAAVDALFDRVAEAAHELDEEVTCTGGRWDDEREVWQAVTGNVTVRLSRLPEDLVEREGA